MLSNEELKAYVSVAMRNLKGITSALKRQIYMLENQESEEGSESESDGSEEGKEENPLISVHAINSASSSNFRIMRVTSKYRKRAIHILIDSGSTHNFLDIHLAKSLGLKIIQVKPVKVVVADGNSLSYDSLCRAVKWTLQGTIFITDVLLLPLGNCDMVLGIQWLENLGTIQWDFKNLSMEFSCQGKRHVLRGCAQGQLQTISSKSLDKMLP